MEGRGGGEDGAVWRRGGGRGEESEGMLQGGRKTRVREQQERPGECRDTLREMQMTPEYQITN